jgi:hypothetical protein
MDNYFVGHSKHPRHLSSGAVLTNEKGEICVHHFDNPELLRGLWTEAGIVDFYLLMRETPNPNETLEHALHRGLMEEFGAKATIEDYLGSIKSNFKHKDVVVEKTTIYFLCKLVSQDETLRKGDIESKTKLEWHTPQFLIPKMKEQAVRYGRTDVDESSILEKL